MRRTTWALFVGIGLLTNACGTSYPLDIPEEEWKAMSVEERAEARQTDAELQRAAEERRAAEAEARAAEARERVEELAKARRQADYGERVQCVLRDAKAHLAGTWRSIQPVTLDLVTGMEVEVELAETVDDGLRYSDEGYASFNGQTVQICDHSADQRDGSDNCARLLGTFKDYQRGVKQTIKGQHFLRGYLRCDLVPQVHSQPNVIINQ